MRRPEAAPLTPVSPLCLWSRMPLICAACGTRSPRKNPGWCPSCGLDNAWVDDTGVSVASGRVGAAADGLIRADALHVATVTRMRSGGPLDTVLGGGIPCGSALLAWGPSGSGKTRIALQIAREIHPVAVVSLEMTTTDTMATLSALRVPLPHVWVTRSMDWRPLVASAPARPRVVIVDSLSVYGRDVEQEMRRIYDWSHSVCITVIAICHATTEGRAKGGTGPTHWSDAAIIVRSKGRGRVTVDTPAKNRFGPTGPGRPIGRGLII